MKKYIILFVVVTITATLISCTGLANNFSYMKNLEDTLSKKYYTQNISINITDKSLIVSFVNTKFNNYDTKEKRKMAREIGRIVISTQKDTSQFKNGILNFINKNSYGIVTTSNSESYNMALIYPERKESIK